MNTVNSAIKRLFKIISELEEAYPGRPFTLDGHLLGSIGEVLVAEKYGLELMKPSNKGYDAIDQKGRQVEIKVTQGKRVAFRHKPKYAIVAKLDSKAKLEIIYNGPGTPIWNEFKNKKLPSNGQYSIGLKKLSEIGEGIGIPKK
ncbi:MAG: hypothetical protein HQK83_04665 [Fibrobacteria bacterium]|nr:hypothetical protein [Fibrobacteria bacterium]